MELTHAIEEGKLLLAQKLVKDKLYEQAMDALKALKCPEGSFEQGKVCFINFPFKIFPLFFIN